MGVNASSRVGTAVLVLLCVVALQPAQISAADRARAQQSDAPREVIEYLRSAAISLATTDPYADLADMDQVKPVIGDARIVAMGEATHGTREFFRMKHRMFEFLVEKMGFSVFAIEANWPESLAVNDYVLNGKGDAARALAGLYFWTWNTEEVLHLIRWMRRYNENPSHAHKVKFYGFDMQFARVAVGNLESYFEKVDPSEAVKATDILSPLSDQASEEAYRNKPLAVRKKTADGIKLLLSDFENHKSEYIATSSQKEWSLAQHNLEIVRQAEELYSAPPFSMIRDHYMAENVKWILDHEPSGTKMMLWAHNAHVGTTPWERGESMGAALRTIYGKEMVICGFSFYEGSFQAVVPHQGLQTILVGASPSNTLDAAFADTGIPLFAIDLRRIPKNKAVKNWLAQSHEIRTIGAVYNEAFAKSYFARVMPDCFDVLFFVKWTTAARKNPPLPKQMDTDFGSG